MFFSMIRVFGENTDDVVWREGTCLGSKLYVVWQLVMMGVILRRQV